jgi:hypothetical protein
MTLCPNCGTWIAEEELDCGCWTCGFTPQDVKRETKEVETTSPSIPLLAKEREAGGEDNA